MSMRKIIVENEDYEYKVGKRFVDIRGPNGFKRTPQKHQASMGFYSAKEIEKNEAAITPAMIALYIMSQLNEAKKKK